jgi:RimJ/RimL family protein N-acetyltransferase
MHVTLVSVYRLPKVAPELLYRLLAEREPHMNISHHGMPTWKEHLRFIAKRPYSAWYLIKHEQDYIGAIYLTALGEIGIGVLTAARGQGVGPAAIRALMRKHPRHRFLANINPDNARSIRMFGEMGFRLIQHTYELRSK